MSEKLATMPAVVPKNKRVLDWETILDRLEGKTTLEYSVGRTIFEQGDVAETLFYLQSGKVKLKVKSQQGKEAIVAIIGPREIFGEGCLAGQASRIASAVTLSDCTLIRVNKVQMMSLLHKDHQVSELFVKQLLNRNTRFEADLVDQLFNNCERRLARTLLLLAHYDKESQAEHVVPGVNQELLAQMIGTTRSRVSHFMNKFRELGFIDYNGSSLTVNSGLLGMVLHD